MDMTRNAQESYLLLESLERNVPLGAGHFAFRVDFYWTIRRVGIIYESLNQQFHFNMALVQKQ